MAKAVCYTKTRMGRAVGRGCMVVVLGAGSGCTPRVLPSNVHGEIPEPVAGELAELASADLDCPRDHVHLARLDAQSVSARGCERELVYIMSIAGRWMLDSTDGRAVPRAAGQDRVGEAPAAPVQLPR